MDITEVTTEGLRRQLKVVVGADELERRLSARLDAVSYTHLTLPTNREV